MTPFPLTLTILVLTTTASVRAVPVPALLPAPIPSTRQLPALHWEPRSDWINVKLDTTPAAVGDGMADDTAAIQNGLDRIAAAAHEGGPDTKDACTLYFPPGRYRITRTLSLIGPILGSMVVGCGRDTSLVWDGPAGGKMLFVNGVAHSKFVGLDLDGRNRAADGFWYKSDKRFQTEVTHRDLAFRHFTDAGLLEDTTRALALAETTFENCLFEDCFRGVSYTQFNDYDYTFDGCEFRRCGTAIECICGNFYIRDCHFEGSRVADIVDRSEHSSSVRRCTSTGSNCFLLRSSSVAPITIQDCQIDRWKSRGGAIVLSWPPALLFDCVFTHPPDGQAGSSAPVRAEVEGQPVLVSDDRVEGNGDLFGGGFRPKVYTIPNGHFSGGLKSSEQGFLKAQVRIPGQIFDAKRDFGAKGDRKTDDTTAIQKAIDAAAAAGANAMAYLPKGRYVISRSLSITGANFFVGGCGWRTRLEWKGPDGGTMIEVHDTRQVTLQNLAVGDEGNATHNAMDIHETGTGAGSSMTYDGVYAYGMYQNQPFRKGFWFTNLGPADVVVMPHVQGNLHFVDCGAATVLANCSYEGSVVVEGKKPARGGLLGFQTRLATLVPYGLYLRDSQNIVMSDFYVEGSQNGFRFEGSPGDPAGRATIQGAKVDFTVPQNDPGGNIAFDIRDYHGQIFFGPDQFYVQPKLKRIRQSGDSPVELYLVGCAWYDSKPDVQLGPAAKLFTIGNKTFGMKSVQYSAQDVMTPSTLAEMSLALDDLRRLGDVDLRLNHGP